MDCFVSGATQNSKTIYVKLKKNFFFSFFCISLLLDVMVITFLPKALLMTEKVPPVPVPFAFVWLI